MNNKRLRRCYNRMIHRCTVITDKDYKHYGERGITICDEWLDKKNGFNNFYSWAINSGYTDELTIDRIDVNGNYCPENCRWITKQEQHYNMRTNVVITYNGKTMIAKQWAEYLGMSYKALLIRYGKGLPLKDVLNPHVKSNRRFVKFRGYNLSVGEWAKVFNIKQDTLSGRLKRANYDMEIVYSKFKDIHDGYNKFIQDNSEIT